MPVTWPCSSVVILTLAGQLAHGVSAAPESGTFTLVILPHLGQTISCVCIVFAQGLEALLTVLFYMRASVIHPVIRAMVRTVFCASVERPPHLACGS